jgi:hypothetical protein
LRCQEHPKHPPADSSPTGVEENLPWTRRVKDMPSSKYAGKLLNLADNYLYVAFFDEADEKLMGKVIKVRGQGRGKSWKPANKTTAFLLYLLNRENNDSIDYATLTTLVNKKFANIPDNAIDEVLDSLDQTKALDVLDGSVVSTNFDPLDIFTGSKINWEVPALIAVPRNSDFRSTHGYSPGYVMITIWK